LSETYPWSWYSDPAVLGLEQERIFRPAWHYVCHEGRLPERGYAAVSAGAIPAVVTRDAEGRVRALLNVCRHRGSVVAEGDGRRDTLQCGYHAWTYGLDGHLRTAPRADREEGFSSEGLDLVPLRLARLGPLLFVSAADDPPPLEEALGGLPERLAEHGVELGSLVFRERAEYTVEANWKVALENYLECYHCPVAHPGFSRLVDTDPEAYRLEARAPCWSQVGQAKDGSGLCHFHLVWPALKVNVYPGPANFSIGPVWPDGPGRTRGFLDYFFGPEVEDAAARSLIAFDDQVGREDAALVAAVQRGVEAGLVERGRLLPASERLIQDFQRVVADSLT
jgi:nitrite reductase/ring-hydroxylating ferredoxin subunit